MIRDIVGIVAIVCMTAAGCAIMWHNLMIGTMSGFVCACAMAMMVTLMMLYVNDVKPYGGTVSL